MEISAENQEREITIFTNGQLPEVQVTTRREEAKENVNENLAPVIVVSENMEAVKGAAKYAQTFDDVLLNLPTIIKAIPAAETAVQAKDDAVAAKESAQESAETAESAAVRAEETLSKMTRVMEYKGNVATFNDLPTTAKIGDVWNVLDTGANYAWDGTTWDKFGELVDLSGYYTKEEAQTALAEKQDTLTAGEGITIEGNVISASAQMPEGIFTEDNLVGGTDIEIVKKSGGIDEHTAALWHLDTDVIDSVNGIALQYPSKLSTTDGIFGGCVQNYTDSRANDISVLGLTSSDSWTMDFWLKYQTYKSSGIGDYGLGSTYSGTSNALTIGFYRYELRLSGIGWGAARNTTIKDFAGISTPWYHMAIQYDAKNKIGSVFVNGEPVYEGAVTIADGSLFSHMALENGPGVLFDEIRISNTLRYSGKFTPPDAPYEAGSAGHAINFVGEKADTDLGNIPSNYDYVVESKYPTEDSPSWYRVYKSGWVEQGGRVSSSTENTALTITLLKPMKNNRYCVQRTSASSSATAATFRSFGVTGITTTTFNMYITDTLSPTYWYVCGQGA